MLHRTLVVVSLVVFAIFLIVSVAAAQAATPADTGGACSLATPCTDVPATGGTAERGSIAFAAPAAASEAPAAQEPGNQGFGLAWAVMGLLIGALLYAFVAAILAALGRGVPVFGERAGVLIPVLSIIGLGVAIYLTYVETQNVAAVCGPVGDCNAVQASPFAELFGFLPVGLLGALGYVAILVAWFVERRSEGRLGRLAPLALFGMAFFGVLFSMYLTYLELYIIRAVCIWCLTSAVIMSIVLVLSVGSAVDALQSE